jgi:hypothetical protein
MNITSSPSMSSRIGKPRMCLLSLLMRILLGLLALLLVLGGLGVSYEAIMSSGDATRYPAPGQLVDVGGYRMHIHCMGTGMPTVVLNSGAGGFSAEWSLVQPELAKTTDCAVYGRYRASWGGWAGLDAHGAGRRWAVGWNRDWALGWDNVCEPAVWDELCSDAQCDHRK